MQSHSSASPTISLLSTLLLLHFSSLQAQSPLSAPTPSLDCSTALLNLTSCLTYVASGSNLTRPEKGCCSALAGVLATEAVCLCQLIASYDDLGVQIDTVRVLELPTICRVDAPPSSLCSKAGAPIGSLSSSPSKSPEEPSVTATAAPASSSSNRSTIKLWHQLFLATFIYCLCPHFMIGRSSH